MCKLTCSIVTAVIGCILVIASFLIGFLVVPSLVESVIKSEVILYDDTIQFERFEEVPFPLTFNLRVFTLANPQEVLTGAVPIMEEVGPYVYKLYQRRNITYATEDTLRYRRIDHFEFDAEASYPLTEDDIVTIINVPYHAIIQVAQKSFPSLVAILNQAMGSVFGELNSPVLNVRVGDLLFDGIRICVNPGLLGAVACSIIRSIGADAQNLVEQDDGSIVFSLLSYRNGFPSIEYEVLRGKADSAQLGEILTMGDLPHFLYWVNEADGSTSRCNMINGTDSGIFNPFIDTSKSLYAINTDICRSVELRYQNDVNIDGIPAVHYSANEWFLDNNEGCFCLNVTEGITRDDGCLLSGAMEMYSCVGALLVLTYPHFMYADPRYRNGVIGMTPREMDHRLFIEMEPNTGTPIRGAKRAQFNIFQRPISAVPATRDLHLALVPIVWVEEAIDLEEQYKDELRNRLLLPLNLLDIFIPVFIAVCCMVLLVGLGCVWRAKLRLRKPEQTVLETANKE